MADSAAGSNTSNTDANRDAFDEECSFVIPDDYAYTRANVEVSNCGPE